MCFRKAFVSLPFGAPATLLCFRLDVVCFGIDFVSIRKAPRYLDPCRDCHIVGFSPVQGGIYDRLEHVLVSTATLLSFRKALGFLLSDETIRILCFRLDTVCFRKTFVSFGKTPRCQSDRIPDHYSPVVWLCLSERLFISLSFGEHSWFCASEVRHIVSEMFLFRSDRQLLSTCA